MLANLLLVFLIGADALIDRHVVRDCAGANLDQALSACSRIIDVMPHSVRQVAVVYLYRGRAEYAKHEAQQAIGDYTRAIAIDPRLAAAFSERGSAYLSLQRVDLAISDCTQAIKINPNHAVYRYNCGNAYWQPSLKRFMTSIPPRTACLPCTCTASRAWDLDAELPRPTEYITRPFRG